MLTDSDYDADFVNEIDLHGKRFAYVWYAGYLSYLCSALTSMKMLKNVSQSSNLTIDYVLTFVEKDLNKSQIGMDSLKEWEAQGGKLKNITSLTRYLPQNYFMHTLEKFHSFLMSEYSRIVVLDSDGIPFCDLNHLFRLKFPQGVHLAAPQGYWYKNYGTIRGYPACPEKEINYVSTDLLVVEPSESLYQKAERHFGTKWDRVGNGGALFEDPSNREGQLPNYDGDIVNIEFGCNGSILVLPKSYTTLSPEFKITDQEGLSVKFSQCRKLSNICYLHFSGEDKPWEFVDWMDDETYDGEFVKVMEQWYINMIKVCPKFITPLLQLSMEQDNSHDNQ